MMSPREPAHAQMARAVALLVLRPRTHTDLRNLVGVHKDVPRNWTTVLHATGLIYISGWAISTDRGPRMALWAWQAVPFQQPDAPRPDKARIPAERRAVSRVERRVDPVRLMLINERRSRIAAAADAITARKEATQARRAAAAQAKLEAVLARQEAIAAACRAEEVRRTTEHAKTIRARRSIFDLAAAQGERS